MSDRKLKKTDYIVIALVGVLLLIIAVPSGSKIATTNTTSSSTSTSDEKRLKDILENMEGVGKTRVMISTTGEEQGVFSEGKIKVEGVVVVAEGAGSAYDFGKTLFPNLEEDDIIIFNCVLLTNDLVEDEEDHFCDEDFEYNVDKYIEMFNKRIRPLLVVFDRNIRTYVNEKGKEVDNILITNPKDRKTFTEEETKLVSGQPFNETDQDTYEQLMTMEDKEIRFWLSIGKVPTYIEYIDGMDWEKIKEEYLLRQEEMKQDCIKQEIEQYNKIIENLTQNDVTELVEDGILPEKLLSIIDENFQTGTFKSKKWGIKLGTIYDIIDKDFNKTEEIEE